MDVSITPAAFPLTQQSPSQQADVCHRLDSDRTLERRQVGRDETSQTPLLCHQFFCDSRLEMEADEWSEKQMKKRTEKRILRMKGHRKGPPPVDIWTLLHQQTLGRETDLLLGRVAAARPPSWLSSDLDQQHRSADTALKFCDGGPAGAEVGQKTGGAPAVCANNRRKQFLLLCVRTRNFIIQSNTDLSRFEHKVQVLHPAFQRKRLKRINKWRRFFFFDKNLFFKYTDDFDIIHEKSSLFQLLAFHLW